MPIVWGGGNIFFGGGSGGSGGGGGGISGLTAGTIPKAASSTTIADSILIQGTNLISQRNGANAQTQNLYGTYTDASNYERLSISATAGVGFTIVPETLGTGSADLDLILSSASSTSGSVKIKAFSQTRGLRIVRGSDGDRGLYIGTDSGGYPYVTLHPSAPILLFYGSSYGDEIFQISDAAGFQFISRTKPAADASTRGAIAYVAGGAGVADTIEICLKDAADAYSWVSLV